jgi:hypothetical protein
VLERFALSPIANQIAERSPLSIGERTIEFEVEIESFLTEGMCEQMFCVKPRAFHTMILEIADRRR